MYRDAVCAAGEAALSGPEKGAQAPSEAFGGANSKGWRP